MNIKWLVDYAQTGIWCYALVFDDYWKGDRLQDKGYFADIFSLVR
jgi:hypothetical protein